ncbi:MAG TPA: beta-galactosidase trimerization domain-containing protein [Anaerolineae bacterium]|nr:beta-galactosidase trimerization domain-containing protein [Anaerolineae bacterium]
MGTIRYLQKDGRPRYLVGVNYWARHAGPLMWRDWRPERVRAELCEMRGLGMNVCRSFLYTPDFMPAPDTVDPVMLERLAEFLALCDEVGIDTIPTFFVGHMSGENWDLPWRGSRDLYTDPWMLQQEALYVQAVVRRVHRAPALAGWLLSNEVPLYGGDTDAASAVRWAERLAASIREVDHTHPIGVGDGAWPLLGNNNGFALEPLAKVADLIGPHIYATGSDALRHSLLPAWSITAASGYGLPAILEEFGCSVFAAGGAGTLGWCFADFDLPTQRPYAHHAFELLFGVTTSNGEPKPAAEEIARFARAIERIDLSAYRLSEPAAYLIEPSSMRHAYPFYGWLSPGAIAQMLHEAFTLSRQARLDVGVWREPAIACNCPEDIAGPGAVALPAGARLLIAPHMAHLNAPTWEALAAYARSGGTVYLSYAQGWSIHNFEALTGCQHHLRYGLADIPASPLEITLRRPLASLPAGTRLHYEVPQGQARSGYCPVQPVAAEVVAVDGEGHPAILEHRLGAGRVIFCAFPLEHYIAQAHEAHRSDSTWRLYHALRELAGLTPLVDGDNPFVEVRYLEGPGDCLVWAINHSWQPQQVTLRAHFSVLEARDLETGAEAMLELSLPKKQVRVLRLLSPS